MKSTLCRKELLPVPASAAGKPQLRRREALISEPLDLASSGCAFELRRRGTLSGYALLDSSPSSSSRHLIAIDFLSLDELQTRTIDEEFWTSRLRAAIARRDPQLMIYSRKKQQQQEEEQQQQQRHVMMAGSTNTALRLVHGSADGLPHIFLDQIGPAAFSIGCDSLVMCRVALPILARAVKQLLSPLELLVSVPQDILDTLLNGSASSSSSSASPPLRTELVSDAAVGSALLPRESHFTEWTPTSNTTSSTSASSLLQLPRISGSLPDADFRSRSLRRFLNQVAVGRNVALVGCDIATGLAVKAAPCAAMLVFVQKQQDISAAQKYLVSNTSGVSSSSASASSSSSSRGAAVVVPGNAADLDPVQLAAYHQSTMENSSSNKTDDAQQQQQQPHLRLVVIGVPAHDDDDDGRAVDFVARQLIALRPFCLPDCLVVFTANSSISSAHHLWPDARGGGAGTGLSQEKKNKKKTPPLQHAFDECSRRLGGEYSNALLRIVKVFEASALPDFPAASGNEWGASGEQCATGIVCCF